MISDSIPNASIAMATSNPKDFSKKKRANRSAKLKQGKLHARREQWLSKAKNKVVCKEELNGGVGTPGGPLERGRPTEKVEIKLRGEEKIYGDGLPVDHYIEFASSPSNSHTSSVLGSNDSGVNFTVSSRSGSSQSSCSSVNGCCSESMSEVEEEDVGDDGCLDDWEALADALAATDKKNLAHGPESEFPSSHSDEHALSGVDLKSESGGTAVPMAQVNFQAWRPDDAFRPQGLPNLSKQYSFPLNSERHFVLGGSVWGCKNDVPVPTSCPVCYEDLDCTDSNFLPCLCGFRLCLFCHKKILEQDARCPGCRKKYENDPVEGEATLEGGSLTFRLARSCSMITRS